MDKAQLKEAILAFIPEAEIDTDSQFLTAVVAKEKVHEVAHFLKTSPDLAFDYLFCETAVDYQDRFALVYHLDSTTHRHEMVLKTSIADRENPEVDSMCDIWIGAEYHEREIFDLFGITFTNHPDLRKIFLDNDWVGFPMRKDYTDPVNIVER